MSLDECQAAYMEMSKEIFKPKKNQLRMFKIIYRFLMAERFDSQKFEMIIRKIIKKHTGDENSPFQIDSETSSRCKV